MGRDLAAGSGCLFEWTAIAGYFAMAFLLGSWVMALGPLALAALVIGYVVITDRFGAK